MSLDVNLEMDISIPTTSALSPSQIIPPNAAISKFLGRLSRSALISLALDWLDDRNQENTFPYLVDKDGENDPNDMYPPASSFVALREIYTDLQSAKGSKRDVLDRIIEGDWRDGLTLYQLAMADMQYLYSHPLSQKWSALKIVRLSVDSDTNAKAPTLLPRFHPSTFLQNLQKEVLPDVKAHYNLDRHATLPLLLLRIYILDSPYNTSLALPANPTTLAASKTFYIAFPDASPYIYISLISSTGGNTGVTDTKSLRKLTLDGIPKAFSRPRERYKLETTAFSTRNLEALCERRGGGRGNAASGGWATYAEERREDNPLNPLPHESLFLPDEDMLVEDRSKKERSTGMKRSHDSNNDEIAKRRKVLAQNRFGNSAKLDDGKGIERFDVRIEDPFPKFSSYGSSTHVEPDTSIESISTGRSRKPRASRGRRSTLTAELERSTDEDDALAAAEVERQVSWKPYIGITLHGTHVFAGVRDLVERGVIDGRKMPGWMTGEDGVSVGVVRDGRLKNRGV